MSNYSVNLGHTYFLLDNGEILYSSKGIDPKYIKNCGDCLKIEAYIMTSPKTFTSRMCRIIASAYTLDEIEEKEKEYFLANSEKINLFFKNLVGERHSYRPSDMTKRINDLKKINQLRIIKYIRKEERQKYKNCL